MTSPPRNSVSSSAEGGSGEWGGWRYLFREIMGRTGSQEAIWWTYSVQSPALASVPRAGFRLEETLPKSGIWEGREWCVETFRLGVISGRNSCLFTLLANKNSFQSLPEQPWGGNGTQVYIPPDFPSRISQSANALLWSPGGQSLRSVNYSVRTLGAAGRWGRTQGTSWEPCSKLPFRPAHASILSDS